MLQRYAVARHSASKLMIVLLAMFLALPVMPSFAAPAVQLTNTQALDGVTSVALGQYAFREVAGGETVTYEVSIPDQGLYFVTAVDEAAADFDLEVLDAEGTLLYNDIFDTIEFETVPGQLTLQFTAISDSLLTFVVVGQIGTMSDDLDQPGQLYNGSVYIEEDISTARNAIINLPKTSYPQQALIYVETGEDDIFFVSAEGDDVGYESITTDSDDLLRFWTHGGEILLYAEPYERRSSLTVIVFLSGRPMPIALETEIEGTLGVDTTEAVYEFEVDATYTDVIVEVDGDAPLNLYLVDHATDTEVSYESYAGEELYADNLYPGTYYLFVEADEPPTQDIEFTLYASGTRGRPLGTLEEGVVAEATFEEGEGSILYAYEVDAPGTLVEVTLAGDPDDVADFDLFGGMRPGVRIWTNYIYGTDETLTFVAPIAGTYYVGVLSNGDVGSYSIVANALGPAPVLEPGQLTVGSVDPNSTSSYQLNITRPNQMLTVLLVGSSNIDIDLEVTGYDSEGNNILTTGSYELGSAEIVSYLVEEPGLYEVEISGRYSDEGSVYFIEARVDDPEFFGAQWAIDAAASSQFGDPDYAAIQATGFNDSTWGADLPTAWAAEAPDGGIETLELLYSVPVIPNAVAIYETYNPGAVVAVEGYDIANDTWVVLWEGEAAPPEDIARRFVPELADVSFKTDTIRLTLDTAAVEGWNEIDAVQLFGRP